MRTTIWLRDRLDHKTTDALKWFFDKTREKTGLFLVFCEMDARRVRPMLLHLTDGIKPRPHQKSIRSWGSQLRGRHPQIIVIDNCELMPAKVFVGEVLPMFISIEEILLTCTRHNNYVVRSVIGVQKQLDFISRVIGEIK